MTVASTAEQLLAAADTVQGVRVYRDPGATVDPPAVVLGPPVLQFESGLPGPTGARFGLFVVVAADERALEALWTLVPAVADVIDALTDAVVIEATPVAFPTSGTDLPAYLIEIEVNLND